jgi:hypothetical protein
LLPRLYYFFEAFGASWKSILVFNRKVIANIFSTNFATKRAVDQGVRVISPIPILLEERMVRGIPTSLINFNAVHLIWFFLGWGLLADVFGCEFLGNLQGGGGFVVNAIKESVKYFLPFSAKVGDD